MTSAFECTCSESRLNYRLQWVLIMEHSISGATPASVSQRQELLKNILTGTLSREQQDRSLMVPILNIQSQSAGSSTIAVQSSTASVPVPVIPFPKFSYKVRIINPCRKSEVIVRQLNSFTGKFDSPNDLRMKLIEEFQAQVPNSMDFAIGYKEGSQQANIWLVTTEDMQTMYKKYSSGNITLWCLEDNLILLRKNKIVKIQHTDRIRKVKLIQHIYSYWISIGTTMIYLDCVYGQE